MRVSVYEDREVVQFPLDRYVLLVSNCIYLTMGKKCPFNLCF